MKKFGSESCRFDGSADVRITRGRARYKLPWWQRWMMPWRWFRAWRKPTVPFPTTTHTP